MSPWMSPEVVGEGPTNQTTSRVIICGAHAPMASEGRAVSLSEKTENFFSVFFSFPLYIVVVVLKRKTIKRVDVGVTLIYEVGRCRSPCSRQPPTSFAVIFLLDTTWRWAAQSQVPVSFFPSTEFPRFFFFFQPIFFRDDDDDYLGFLYEQIGIPPSHLSPLYMSRFFDLFFFFMIFPLGFSLGLAPPS